MAMLDSSAILGELSYHYIKLNKYFINVHVGDDDNLYACLPKLRKVNTR